MAMGMPFSEPLHILGSGSVGLLWASAIRSSFPSYPLAVLFRSHHKSRLGDSTREVTVCTMQNGRPRISSVPIQFIGDSKRNPIRNLVVATKAYQATEAVESIIPRLSTENPTKIMLLCNGALDVREKIMSSILKHDIGNMPELVMCTTTNGVIQEPPDEDMFHLTHVGLGRTYLGGMPSMAELWKHSGLNATHIGQNEMEIFLWKKLAGNCFCNPLTALWKVTNSELQNQPEYATLRKQVIQEAASVAQALHPEWKKDLSECALDSFLGQLIHENFENRSSMYFDVMKGCKTEVENLNGYVVKKGEELGLNTPANEELCTRIQELER